MFNILTIVNLLKSINKQKIKVILTFIIIFTIILCFCDDDEFGGLLALHKRLDEINRTEEEILIEEIKENKIFKLIFDRLYFVFVTMTTVGFGDIVPKSTRVRVFTFIFIIATFVVSLC